MAVTTREGGLSTSASLCEAAGLRRRGEGPDAVLPCRLYVEAAGSGANGEVGSVVNPISVNSTFYIKLE